MPTKTIRHRFVLFGILLLLSVLVVGDIHLSQFLYPLLWGYFPFLFFPLISNKTNWVRITLKTITYAAYGLATFVFILRFIMCGYGPSTDKYVSKANRRIKITGRDFSCYGTTGDLILYKQFTITKTIKLEAYYRTLPDYKGMEPDAAEWTRAEGY